MNHEPEATLRTLHRVYCGLSGHAPPYATCERRLLEFHNAGFTEEDIKDVVEYVKRANRKFGYSGGWSLVFGSLIGNLEKFGDLVGASRADKRDRDHKAKHSFAPDKASVLRASGRPDSATPPERTMKIGDVLKGIRESL